VQSDKKEKIHNFYRPTASDVINDNSSSQPIAVSESWLAAQSVNWNWAERYFLLVKRKSDLTVC